MCEGHIEPEPWGSEAHGHNLAKYRLNMLDKMPFGAADDYLDDNLEKIRTIIGLCEQYESLKEDSRRKLPEKCN